ncbi:probable protein phosphatase 2C 8 isoform X3 [Ricinus communis]|uniref:probable protein phosphatase 2C 8 isoform X3 n=1 Tax=Ricinus communis TaxID=3988 RepID=UPI00077212BD|nr:probable protein phosphatase 2C 8 isoform X3 [Ricinus communis]|eukprot:XP_015575427.1 probable protein phosphatase 2C 8 isoform X3 [Ricinus communis]
MEKAAQSSNQVAESESSNDNKKREGDLEKSNLGIAKKQRTETTSTVENKVIEEEKQKKTSEIEADGAEDKGSRHTMEDAWIVLSDASLESPGTLRCAHFAIYDGHGGRLAAEYAQKHLHKNVVSAGLPRFRKTDESLLRESTAGGWQDGATAVCVWILEDTVFIANIGDAKAVLARSSEVGGSGSQNHSNETSPLKALVLTREHKAIYPVERARIQKAGGSISANGRLQGRLEVSRALGDRQFKKVERVGVIATPDIHSFDLTDREHFIILGCDGLWGVFGPSDAVEFVQRLLKEGLTVKSVSRRLVREAVIERRCKDNCTAIVIVFRH